MKRAMFRTIALGIVAMFMIGTLAMPFCIGTELAVTENDILFDGERIHGLKGFTYKVYKDRQDVRSGDDPIITFDGKIQVMAGSPLQAYMDNHFDNQLGFVAQVNSRVELPDQAQEMEQITLIFEECLVTNRNAYMNEYGEEVVDYQVGLCARVLVHSNSELLNKHMDNNTHFQIILTIMQDSYPEGLGVKQFTFDGCHVDDREFQIDSHGYALTTYTFTSDRLREA